MVRKPAYTPLRRVSFYFEKQMLIACCVGIFHMTNATRRHSRYILFQALSAVITGIFYGTISLRTRCLWDTVILHCFHNVIASFAFEMSNAATINPQTRAVPLIFGVLFYVALLCKGSDGALSSRNQVLDDWRALPSTHVQTSHSPAVLMPAPRTLGR